MKIETEFFLTEIDVDFENDCFLNVSFAYCKIAILPKFYKNTKISRKNLIQKLKLPLKFFSDI